MRNQLDQTFSYNSFHTEQVEKRGHSHAALLYEQIFDLPNKLYFQPPSAPALFLVELGRLIPRRSLEQNYSKSTYGVPTWKFCVTDFGQVVCHFEVVSLLNTTMKSEFRYLNMFLN